MVRKQIYITSELEAELKRLSQVTGESEAELVRQALVSFLRDSSSTPSRLQAWQDELQFMQSLVNKDSVPATRTWTREELYDHDDDNVPR
jgi:hypothetical protein